MLFKYKRLKYNQSSGFIFSRKLNLILKNSRFKKLKYANIYLLNKTRINFISAFLKKNFFDFFLKKFFALNN